MPGMLLSAGIRERVRTISVSFRVDTSTRGRRTRRRGVVYPRNTRA